MVIQQGNAEEPPLNIEVWSSAYNGPSREQTAALGLLLNYWAALTLYDLILPSFSEVEVI